MTTTIGPRLEIAVQDAAGAQIAADGGADRVELCAALGATGGLTPSAATIAGAVGTGIGVHVLVRTRPGGFVYDDAELATLAGDVEAAVRLGAAGVVIGALDAAGKIDLPATRRLVAAARTAGRPVEVTFHRALDVVADPVTALHQLADLGVDRVLTSGGAARAAEGAVTLRRLAEAGTGVQIMAGGGVRPGDIAELVALGVDAIHLSAKMIAVDPGATGPGGGDGPGLERTDPAVVAAARAALTEATGARS